MRPTKNRQSSEKQTNILGVLGRVYTQSESLGLRNELAIQKRFMVFQMEFQNGKFSFFPLPFSLLSNLPPPSRFPLSLLRLLCRLSSFFMENWSSALPSIDKHDSYAIKYVSRKTRKCLFGKQLASSSHTVSSLRFSWHKDIRLGLRLTVRGGGGGGL